MIALFNFNLLITSLIFTETSLFRYFKVSARITNSKGFRAWRAKTFVLADNCNGFYCEGGESESIYYDGNTLVLAILFKSKDDARRFRSALERRAMSFTIISSVTVSDKYEEVILQAEANEVRATHYVHGESDSPQHSLAVSDYESPADEDEDEDDFM